MTKISTYKNVELKYNEDDGLIYFDFENRQHSVKYVFEAKRIIDEPQWVDCDLKGYWVDGYIDKHILEATATRKDIKTDKPDWMGKGIYDNYPKRVENEVYPRNEYNEAVYKKWLQQKVVYSDALRVLNEITRDLK